MWLPVKKAPNQYVFKSDYAASELKIWAIMPVDAALRMSGG
ncbi:hypothetical protein SAMN05444166_8453 [Singulisphaera sp. GP187]|nr:hypothetical protein SAMN05444166_8453 [Singulisphaera sp. GP187]